MKHKNKLFLILTLFSCSNIYANTSTNWVADIRVEDVKITTSSPQGKEYNCTVDIANSNKDDARNSKAIILLSPQVQFAEYTITNTSSQNDDYSAAKCSVKEVTPVATPPQHQTAVVECELGQLTTHAKLSISIDGNVLNTDHFQKLCSSFVYSTTPDHTPMNNFMKSKIIDPKTEEVSCATEPDLIVSKAVIDWVTQSVTVSVKNIGNQDSGSNLTYIEINEVGVGEDKKPQSQYSINIPSLAKGTSWDSAAIPFSAFSERGIDLSTLSNGSAVVRADAKNMIEECNETNNVFDSSS